MHFMQPCKRIEWPVYIDMEWSGSWIKRKKLDAESCIPSIVCYVCLWETERERERGYIALSLYMHALALEDTFKSD